jgi:hypothetical protein
MELMIVHVVGADDRDVVEAVAIDVAALDVMAE